MSTHAPITKDEFVCLLRSPEAKGALQDIVAEFIFLGAVPVHPRCEQLLSEPVIEHHQNPS